ncbi:Uncharacterised protein [Salmonella enterica subsp. enterica serovar Bovismorbificans]|nr:Uncharacterised protein [Salmonella enterica subsp. enterica serovar Bovismorbificans]
MAIDKNIVHRNIHQQAQKSHHHTRFGFGQTFALVSRYLKEKVSWRAPQQRAKITHGFIGQRRINIMHRADNVSGIPQDDHHQHGDKARQPEPLSNLMRDTLTTAGAIELRNHRRQGQQ